MKNIKYFIPILLICFSNTPALTFEHLQKIKQCQEAFFSSKSISQDVITKCVKEKALLICNQGGPGIDILAYNKCQRIHGPKLDMWIQSAHEDPSYWNDD